VRLVSVAENLKRLREAKGWSKLELARRLGGKNSRTEVYLWESGRRTPSKASLDKLASIFELDSDLLDPEGEAVAGPGRKRKSRIQESHTDADTSAVTRRDQAGGTMGESLPPLPDIDLFGQLLGVWRLLETTEARREFVKFARAHIGLAPAQQVASEKKVQR